MFDVFYFGPKPNRFAHEQPADSLEDAAEKSRTQFYWYIYGGNDYTNFDFDFVPAPWEATHIHVFSSQWQRNGDVYLANRDTVHNKEWNWRTEQSVTRLSNEENWELIVPKLLCYPSIDRSWHPDSHDPPYIYHFPSQHQSSCGLIYRVPGATGIKLCRDFTVTVTEDKRNWTIPAGIDDTDFDYSWHPNPLEPDYEYHFPTQWQRDGGPIYPGTAGIKYVSSQRIRANATQIFYMDFLNPQSQTQFKQIQNAYPDIKLTRYVDNHLNVFKRVVNLATTEFVWITSSICDYSEFDFTWHPDPSQREMVHVFPSGAQKRGDTFFVHVESFKRQLYELEILDWFNVINYCDEQYVERFQAPINYYTEDTIINAIQQYQFNFPYALFTNESTIPYADTNMCLWHHKDRQAIAISKSGATTIVPRDIKEYLKTQIYDYPYVARTEHQYFTTEPLDIIFISNGEPDEELMFHHTEYMTNSDVKWIRGVNGRAAAYQAAAQASTTPWFFAVFAKLEVVGNSFPWYEWQPDYWQEPKHYIFNAKNPVNGLVYGHQGMIAYNKKLVLENNNPGIDFTLSQPHESVPLLSGTARFNQDPWMTWRTAFREVVKLKHFMATQPTLETEHRLNTWLTVADGDYAEWCLRGSIDAVDYYKEVAGDYDQLVLSFEWAWLKSRFSILYTV
jgi:hypothetical protein